MRVAPVPAVTSMYTHVTDAAIHGNCQRQPASATRQPAGRQRGLASAALAGTGSDWQLVRRAGVKSLESYAPEVVVRVDDLKIGFNDLLWHLLLVPRLYVCVLGVHPGDSGDAA